MNKSAALRIRIDPQLHRQFLAACKAIDRPAAQVLREFMRDFVEQNASAPQRDLFQEVTLENG